MKYYTIIFLKGISMGIANVIPGVSGGTIALITGVYQQFLDCLKSFDKKAFKLLLSCEFKAFTKHTDFYFLISLLGGCVASLFSIASLFEYLFENYPIYIWAFFFGLIMASIYFVGKQVEKWNKTSIISLIIGTLIALSLSFITPATENNNLFFVFICGIVGISGMMLPGLSGSFILILMGNYELLMVKAITHLDIILLSTFCFGSVFGLMSFAHILSWVFKYYKDATLSILTGFILGSLSIIWPWKSIAESIILNGKEKILSYNWQIPKEFNQETIIALILMIMGVLIVTSLESFEKK